MTAPWSAGSVAPVTQATYSGYTMRWVSINSAYVYETNTLQIKGFTCLLSHHSIMHWFLPNEIKCVFPRYWLKNKCMSEFSRKITVDWNVDQVSVKSISSFPEIFHILCSANHMWKGLTEWWSENTGLISYHQLLITGVCTNTGSRILGIPSQEAGLYQSSLVHVWSTHSFTTT